MIERIRNAEAVFIAGGDQSNYIRYWKDTPVEDAINFVAAKPAPIGGTSAGMAVLGEYVYSAEGKESLTSPAALADPYAPDLTLARGFLALPRLENVITDQHLQERDRIGRTIALLSRLQADGWSAQARARSPPTAKRRCTSIPRPAWPKFLRPRIIRRLTCTSWRRPAPPLQCKTGEPLTTRRHCRVSARAGRSLRSCELARGKRHCLRACASTPASYTRRAGATTETAALANLSA